MKSNAGQTAKGSGSTGPEPSFTKQDTARVSHLPGARFQKPQRLGEDTHLLCSDLCSGETEALETPKSVRS